MHVLKKTHVEQDIFELEDMYTNMYMKTEVKMRKRVEEVKTENEGYRSRLEREIRCTVIGISG